MLTEIIWERAPFWHPHPKIYGMMYRFLIWFKGLGPGPFLLPATVYLIMLIFYSIQDSIITSGWSNITCKNPVPPYLLTGSENYSSKHLNDGITFVTAYFNIGTFRKGPYKTFSTDTYFRWMTNYGFVNNTIILYTDLEDLAIKFRLKRSKFPDYMTKVFLVKQNDFWGFKLKSKINAVFEQPGYPQYFPNTVFAPYSCAMHVKYDVIERVIKERIIQTKYVAWLDIGYFRDKEKEIFTLYTPQDIKDDHISFLQIKAFYNLWPKTIIDDNALWLAGGIFIGRPEYLLLLVEDYRTAVEGMIDMKLMSTDQQVLYTMYSPLSPFQPRVPIQRYYSKNRGMWFYLGDLCREESFILARKTKTIYEVVTSYFY